MTATTTAQQFEGLHAMTQRHGPTKTKFSGSYEPRLRNVTSGGAVWTPPVAADASCRLSPG
jgi:hypothetical protein